MKCWHGEALVVGRRQSDRCLAAEVTEGDLRRGSAEAPRLLAAAATPRPRQEATGEVGLARVIRAGVVRAFGVREDRPGLAKLDLNGDTGRWAEEGLSGDPWRGRDSTASSLLLTPFSLIAADGSVGLDALPCATVVAPTQELLELLLSLLLLPPVTRIVSAVVDCESDSPHFKWCSSRSFSAEWQARFSAAPRTESGPPSSPVSTETAADTDCQRSLPDSPRACAVSTAVFSWLRSNRNRSTTSWQLELRWMQAKGVDGVVACTPRSGIETELAFEDALTASCSKGDVITRTEELAARGHASGVQASWPRLGTIDSREINGGEQGICKDAAELLLVKPA